MAPLAPVMATIRRFFFMAKLAWDYAGTRFASLPGILVDHAIPSLCHCRADGDASSAAIVSTELEGAEWSVCSERGHRSEQTLGIRLFSASADSSPKCNRVSV